MIECAFEAFAILFFFSIMPNVSSTMRTACSSSTILVQARTNPMRKKRHWKSVPRQNRPEVNLNAIDITVHAHTSTPMHIYITYIQWNAEYKRSIETYIWPLTIHSWGENPWKSHFMSSQAPTWTEHTYVVLVSACVFICAQCVSMWLRSAYNSYVHGQKFGMCTYEGWQPHGNIYKWNDKHARNPSLEKKKHPVSNTQEHRIFVFFFQSMQHH